MRRRREPLGVLPAYVLALDPERYRELAEEHLQERPGDTRGAGMAVWRAFLAERRDWLRAHQVRRHVDGRDTLGTPYPPFRWVMDNFGTPPPRWGDLCEGEKRIHGKQEHREAPER